MNVFYLEYRLADGEIVGFGNAFRDGLPLTIALAVEVIDDGLAPDVDPARDKIDLATGQRVRKSDDERARSLRPHAIEVAYQIASELNATDQYMVLDRPIADSVRASWATYRQALRDLSNLGGPVEIITAWPTRPDGADAISHLRSRI